MPPTTLIPVVQSDNDYLLNFTLTDATGAVVNLSGATLTFYGQLVSDALVQFSGAMSIISAVAGTCSYSVATSNFAIVGTYNCQIKANFTSPGEVISFTNIQVVVNPSIPQ